MAFKIVGVNENSDFPTRVENRLATKFASKAAATETTSGIVELATTAEVTTGTDTTRAVTPAGVKSAVDVQKTRIDGLTTSKADKSSVDPIITDVNTRLTDENLKSIGISSALLVERNGSYPVGLFARLREGIMNRTLNTRVVVLGDSHAVGGYTTFYEQGFMQRLAYRCGAKTYRMLGDAVSPVPNGMQWWSGAVGGRSSANYFGSSELAKVSVIQPNYVLHNIGSNDWAQGIPVATFKANVSAAIASINGAAPGVKHLLIQGQKRKDTVPAIPYSAYGTALSEIAAANPTTVAFVDVADSFNVFGLDSDNYTGILTADNTHMGNVGHRFMADLLSGYMGIPIESRFDLGVDVRGITVPNKKTYSVAEVASSITIPAASYPRIAIVSGNWFVNSSHANGEIAIQSSNADTNAAIASYSIRIGSTGERSIPLSASIYIPPAVNTKINFVLGPVGGSTIIISGLDDYFRTYLDIKAL